LESGKLSIYINGKIVPEDEARVSVFDRGFMRGDGLFETMRAYGGRVFMLNEHLARLDRGLEALRFGFRSADLDLEEAVVETVRANNLASARVRAQVMRGVGTTAFTARADTPPTVVVSAMPLGEDLQEPLKVIISSIRRDERSPLAGIKTMNYLPNILARMEAEDAGADDAIMLNYAGHVAEGCSSNVFLVRSGKLITPDLASGVLPGITRQVVLDIASKMGVPTVEKEVDPELLFSAEEVFLTSSTREIVPVARIDGREVGRGGYELTSALAAAYSKAAESCSS